MSTLQYDKIENLSFLSVTGPDSKKLLQGQSSCQFNEFELGQQKLGSFSDAKGRVFANFNAIAINDGFLLQMSADIIEDCLSTLKKYAAFFKVVLKDERDTFKGVVFSGDINSVDVIPSFTPGCVVQDESTLWLFHTDSLVECWTKNDESLITKISDETQQVDELLVNHSIDMGIPWLTHENVGAFIAQMLNLELIGAIDFKKGCYTGQEIIARLHYKGKSKKRLHRVAVDQVLLAGTDIVNQASKVIGKVVNSSSKQALISATINEQFYLKDKLENPLELLDLPYQF
ncbi:MAG: folate-binding protein YgfZ [Saccharospirillaceae bacterium]|nr:hypothetical protein [Pseudomonadales bacterium]NRB79541.1 folate-binding protein YgfZ [Saccharospirillaceae bacterium]